MSLKDWWKTESQLRGLGCLPLSLTAAGIAVAESEDLLDLLGYPSVTPAGGSWVDDDAS
jgi:hypothetical protein